MSDKPSLLPNNATNLERNIEQVTSRIDDVPVDEIYKLWNPDTCPAELLPWLAWAMSLDAWKSYWPEEVKRARIRNALEIQRKKGTVKSVRDVVESFGGNMSIRQWHETVPRGVPHTFEISLIVGGSVPGTAEYQQDVINEVTRVKPKRSQFTLIAGVLAEGGIGMQAIVRTASYIRIETIEAPYRAGIGFEGQIRPVTYIRLETSEA